MKRLGYCKRIKAKHLLTILSLGLDEIMLESILLTPIKGNKKTALDGTSKTA